MVAKTRYDNNHDHDAGTAKTPALRVAVSSAAEMLHHMSHWADSDSTRNELRSLIARRPEAADLILDAVRHAQALFVEPRLTIKTDWLAERQTRLVVAVEVGGDYVEFSRREDQFNDWVIARDLDVDADLDIYAFYTGA